MNLILLFIILNIVNVIVQTVKSIATVKCGKTVAALVNAVAFGIYTIVLVYMNCELNLWAKVAIVALTNLIGVYFVKAIEEKMRKDKLWKIEMTIPQKFTEMVNEELKDISHSIITIDENYTLFNFYCATQKESTKVKEIVKKYGAKYFISESKNF